MNTLPELRAHSLANACSQVAEWRKQGEKIVFTNGVFDILHIGHVTYLQQAKALGHRLVVGLNSDASVRALGKGSERPIHPEPARAGVLLALKAVDMVIVFSDHTPLELIEALHPDVLVKGGDYDPEETDQASKRYMVGAKETKQRGGSVVAIPLVEGFSTTQIVGKLKG
jgi:D-beta-D-heptose 7-phosphate kinase/D-beta-D-heptose 1-phosphate adenosyltransferase